MLCRKPTGWTRAFLNKLLIKHSSGVSVLAAPGKFPQFHATNEAIDKLISVARQEFDNVIVDVGARLDLTDTALFRDAFTIYLVTQAGIPELRNSNRLISQFFTVGSPKLEIVINRYEPRALGVSDETITKALTRPANWKIPNDYRRGPADAEHRDAAGPGRFPHFTPHPPDGNLHLRTARYATQKERLQTFRMTLPAKERSVSMEGATWNC